MPDSEGAPNHVGGSRGGLARAALVTLGVVAVLFALFYAAAFLLVTALDIPFRLTLPATARWFGLGVVIVSLAIAVWVFQCRKSADMLRSTSATFAKLFVRTHISRPLGRNEPLVIVGPQRYVRHPLYLSVMLGVVGWGLFSASTVALAEAIPFALWFILVQIPFEERELIALLGEQYREYREKTPMLLPISKHRI
jgi:protein-S-isoprenylcysteine O-methyltransferase Ste14